MEAHAVADAAQFLERAGPLLDADQSRHNLILALAWLLHDRPGLYPEFALWVVEEGDRPVAAALMTPPFKLVLADAADPAALQPLARAVLASGRPVPGVVGNRPTVDAFNRTWALLTGVAVRPGMRQGVFALERVRATDPCPGGSRPAAPGDRDLVMAWMVAFNAEALPEEPDEPEARRRMVDHRLDPDTRDAGFWLWEDDGAAVSLVGFGGPFPGGARIGPVYTPPERRRRGYGTALVAAVSAWLLEQGRRGCFLYTDLANPTSNAIYRRIGYRQVAESAEYYYRPSS